MLPYWRIGFTCGHSVAVWGEMKLLLGVDVSLIGLGKTEQPFAVNLFKIHGLPVALLAQVLDCRRVSFYLLVANLGPVSLRFLAHFLD